MQAGPFGMVAAYHNIASRFLNTVRSEFAAQTRDLAQAGPLASFALRPQAAVFALHATARELAAGGLTSLELYKQGAQDAAQLGLRGQAALAHAWNYAQNPPEQALRQATLIREQAAGSGQMGAWGQRIGDALDTLRAGGTLGEFIGDAIWPVFRLPWKLTTQAAEYSPFGSVGTFLDVLSGLRGQGPYAGATAADIIPSLRNQPGMATPFQEPVQAGVTPLAARFQHNFFGMALTIAGALKGLDGTVTGAGPDDPVARRQLEATGWKPYSVLLGDHYVSYDQIPGAQLTLGLIGDYHDAIAYPTSTETGQAQAGMGGGQLPMGAPLGGGAGRADYTAMRLFTHVLDHMATLSGLTNMVDAFSALGIGGGEAGAGPLNALTTEAANVLGPLVPMSGALRTAALAQDVGERRPLPENIGQQLEQNLPFLRQNVPPALSPSGQPIPNVRSGAAALFPLRVGAPMGSDPVSRAFSSAQLTLSGAPPALQLGNGREVTLWPDQQRRYEQAKGTALQDMVGPLAASGSLDSMPIGARQQVLLRMEGQADRVAMAQTLGSLSSSELVRQTAIARGPAATTLTSYISPAMAVSPADLQQAFANQQALRGALGLPTSRALLQQQLAG
jgi:hypothetical protein